VLYQSLTLGPSKFTHIPKNLFCFICVLGSPSSVIVLSIASTLRGGPLARAGMCYGSESTRLGRILTIYRDPNRRRPTLSSNLGFRQAYVLQSQPFLCHLGSTTITTLER